MTEDQFDLLALCHWVKHLVHLRAAQWKVNLSHPPTSTTHPALPSNKLDAVGEKGEGGWVMGIAMFSSGSDPTPPNPNPALFTILNGFNYQECCVLVVRYPGCTTFEGKKVLVLLGKVSDYVGIKNLDPHFTTDGYLVARFVPTESGIQCAKDFAQRVRVRKPLPTEMAKAFWDVREGAK